MKRNLTWMGIFVLLTFGLTIFTGCAEKKSVVTNDTIKTTAPAQTAPQTTETSKPNDAANLNTINQNDTAREQSAKVEKTATAEDYIRDINFDFDSSIIRPDAREILKVNADFLLKNRISSIVIEGHCDERGTAEYNMALGQKRAQETKTYLINLGIKESIIRTISYGEERPLDPGNNEEAWANNRRAHFVVTP
ncbi:MAG: peptidoglycan-associated lipoprotein Pal [Smithella sp.]|jgi:peptidoglycan-associated lipoprotein